MHRCTVYGRKRRAVPSVEQETGRSTHAFGVYPGLRWYHRDPAPVEEQSFFAPTDFVMAQRQLAGRTFPFAGAYPAHEQTATTGILKPYLRRPAKQIDVASKPRPADRIALKLDPVPSVG